LTFCRRCGAQLEENAKFCHKCGTPVVTVAAQPVFVSARKKNSMLPLIIGLIVVVAVAIIVSAFVFSQFYNSINFNPNSEANQTNVNKLNINIQSTAPKTIQFVQATLTKDTPTVLRTMFRPQRTSPSPDKR